MSHLSLSASRGVDPLFPLPPSSHTRARRRTSQAAEPAKAAKAAKAAEAAEALEPVCVPPIPFRLLHTRVWVSKAPAWELAMSAVGEPASAWTWARRATAAAAAIAGSRGGGGRRWN